MKYVDVNKTGSIDRDEWNNYLTYVWEVAGDSVAWDLCFQLYGAFNLPDPVKK